jgi:hypothetical protein
LLRREAQRIALTLHQAIDARHTAREATEDGVGIEWRGVHALLAAQQLTGLLAHRRRTEVDAEIERDAKRLAKRAMLQARAAETPVGFVEEAT